MYIHVTWVMITSLCRSASTSLLSFRNKYFFGSSPSTLSLPVIQLATGLTPKSSGSSKSTVSLTYKKLLLSNHRSSTWPPVRNKIFPRFQCSMSSGSIVSDPILLVCLEERCHRLTDPCQRSGQSLLLRPLTDHKRRLCLECDHKIRYNKFNPCLFDFSST